MAAKIILLLFITCVILNLVSGLSGNCPTASRIDSCSPKCTSDSNCKGAQFCCTNICGTKSCTNMNQYASDGNKGFKSPQKGATGTYCGNVKCGNYEKCELDRTTKREKCVRT